MQFSQIMETCLYVQNLDQTETFYKDKLQLDVIGKEEGRHIFFRVGRSVLLCFIADATKREKVLPAHYGEGNMHVALEVPKELYDEIKRSIAAKDIEIEHEQQWSEQIHSFYFRDPDGHLLEIVPSGMWG